MIYTIDDLCTCLALRCAWYEKAIAMACGKHPWEVGFDWPDDPQDPTNIQKWRGAVHELVNTLDMLSAQQNMKNK